MPDAVSSPTALRQLLHTSSADGVRSETVGKITVVWKYHPDKGLEATYKYTG